MLFFSDLKKQLELLWNDYINTSTSASVSDFLSVEHLGYILEHLALRGIIIYPPPPPPCKGYGGYTGFNVSVFSGRPSVDMKCLCMHRISLQTLYIYIYIYTTYTVASTFNNL